MKSSNVSLRRHETLRHGLLRTVQVLIDSVTALSEQSRNDEQPIHRIRTTIKRLRALLRLIRPAVESGFFDSENERLRTAGRLLSVARDSEVARDTVKTLPISHQSTRDAINAVSPGLEKRVERAKAHEPNVTEVKQRLEQTRRSFRQLEFRGTDEEIIKAGIRRVYREARRRMKAAIRTGGDRAYHRWRIRAKHLYCELQFLEQIWPNQLHRMVSRLSKLQDRLGLDHDLIVLRAELTKTPEAFGGKEAVQRIVSSLERQTNKLRRTFRSRSGAKFGDKNHAAFLAASRGIGAKDKRLSLFRPL
jgi:CHAD domain-containing protein